MKIKTFIAYYYMKITIDIHSILGKNPITRSVLKPKFGYQYCGPYNNLDKQVDYNETTGQIYKVHDKPKNKTDEVCMKHDICYSIGKNKNDCDREMINDFDNLKYGETNKSTSIIREIINTKQKFGLGNNPNEILSNELHKQRKINFTRRRVISNYIDRIWGIDLIPMIKYSKQNRNYKYILTVIDIFSKFSWCYPLKSKKSEEIINSFKDIFKKSKRKPTRIQSDEGTEFTNNQTQNFFKDNNIKWYHTYNRYIKCSICERYNRTILNRIYKNFTLNNNTIWISNLDKLTNKYNNSYHRSIKMKPINASLKSNENIVRNNLYNFRIANKKPKFSIGDKVRVSLLKNTFEKSCTSNWTEEIFIIDGIKTSNVHYYFLKNLKKEKIDGSFYEQELLKTKQNDL